MLHLEMLMILIEIFVGTTTISRCMVVHDNYQMIFMHRRRDAHPHRDKLRGIDFHCARPNLSNQPVSCSLNVIYD